MPINLSSILRQSPKKYKLTFLLLLSPLLFFAQSLTGLWTGTISNDSNTVRKDQSFEIALTEYRGKVYGYSRSEFIVDDVLYYIVKRVKGTIEGDICEVTDDEVISYNFPKKLEKNIKVTSTFQRDKNDSTWYLAGKWKTNATKKYYSVSGNVDLEQENDLAASKIFPHLEELKLADELVFYKERKEGIPIVKIAKPEKLTPAYTPATELSNTDDRAVAKPAILAAEPGILPAKTTGPINSTVNEEVISVVTKQEQPVMKETVIAKNNVDSKTTAPPLNKPADAPGDPIKKEVNNNTNLTAKNETTNSQITPATEKKETANETTVAIKTDNIPVTKNNETATTQVKNNTTDKTITKNEKPEPAGNSIAKHDVTKPKTSEVAAPEKQKEPVVTKKESTLNPNANITQTTIGDNSKTAIIKADPKPETKTIASAIEKKEPVAIPAAPEVKKAAADITLKAAVIEGRKSEFTQVVNFKSDSIMLSLYDNGEIDGDTVSVYLNGEVLMANQGLKASAIKKTIYIPAGTDDFTLVMFAESLGKYPPNTGLLVIRDGSDVYNLRFSSDFQKSSGIVFRRKQ